MEVGTEKEHKIERCVALNCELEGAEVVVRDMFREVIGHANMGRRTRGN